MESTALSSRAKTRAAIVGAGYIAEFHARGIRALPNAELVGVCDVSLQRAKSFGKEWGAPTAYDSLESMMDQKEIDVVHVLAPPDLHYALAKDVLKHGCNAFLEKPMCTSSREADELLEIADLKKRLLGVNHNFLFSDAYQRLREAIRSGTLGPLDYVCLNYLYELGQIRSGPYDSWMLRAPENAFLEVGPHLVSAALDLVGPPSSLSVTTDREVMLPNGVPISRRWRVHMISGRTALDININLAPGFNHRNIVARGVFGSALADLDANTCVVDRRTPLGPDLDRYRRSLSLANQHGVQATRTVANYVLTKLKLKQRGNPYEMSILNSIAAFYTSLRSGAPLDSRIDGKFGRDVMELCGRIVESAHIEEIPIKRKLLRNSATAPDATVLVIGGSGFIGRELVSQLLDAGYAVRVMTRSAAAALESMNSERLEMMRGDLRNEGDLNAAMQGIEFVFDLATSEVKTWEAGLRDVVEPTRRLGEACLAGKVRRLIYTGTIDSYYAGVSAGVITEQTPLDRNIKRRNYYARAKAAAEHVLTDMYQTQGLPVVIVRPGIVIGEGGNAFHWGVGKFSEGVCEVWGEGKNKLPLVLVKDVAAALVRCVQTEGIDGRSYNLVDIPLLSAREYLTELQRLAGIKLTIHHRPIVWFYLSDLLKWIVKLATIHPDRSRIPSYRDWESRTQNGIFNCVHAREDLGWSPASNRLRMINEGIGGSIKSWLDAIK